jgi:hydrogenase maturation protease
VTSRMLLIGIGNEYRRDDSVGLHVIRALKERELPDTVIVENSGDGAELIEMFGSFNIVILIDAVSSDGNPGTIYHFDAYQQHKLAKLSFQSTHAFGVIEAIELARVLGQLPSTLIVYAIVGENFSAGLGLTTKVEQAAQRVVEQVCNEVQNILK